MLSKEELRNLKKEAQAWKTKFYEQKVKMLRMEVSLGDQNAHEEQDIEALKEKREKETPEHRERLETRRRDRRYSLNALFPAELKEIFI